MGLQAADTIADVSALDARSNRTAVNQTEGNLVAHAVFSALDEDVDVYFEQSLDGTNWEGIFDADGEAIHIKCEHKHCQGNTSDHTKIVSVVGFYAPQVRAVVFKNGATQGALEIRMFV